ncbi:winged helix-turn-helix domain-containing protein [Halapricum hydrolyticum]|uniref:Helix-turn-helix domain-containing protein n=1 Tax=Halapricum hydrolyticum TaxID=2979991 RepID=A0AAE3LGB7_9EURY|nr:helix-turn-helix domain-containing protein [Halapricum hydrolyticum]MCU4719550.1 helix-turn-helix domain-containing protein [Halapricum hydrolyticum]MCU4728507.1 helix-turn-helix domain-containing protein [Halapricum hydrolyticum]
MDDRETTDGPEPAPDVEDAFSLLADETRLSILRELYARDEPLTFSELRERVGMRDSGQFNYHLGKLKGQFVEQTDGGYELTMSGFRVLGAVFAGSYDEQTIDPIPIDDPCPLCSGGLEAIYDRDHFEITCEDCETNIVAYPAPPGILRSRDREELPEVFSRYARHILGQITDGFCPFCLGPTAVELDVEKVEGIGANHQCQHCGVDMTMSTGVSLLQVPDVVAFAREHGVDLQDTPLWALDPLFTGDERLVEDADDPATIEIDVIIDDETLTVRLDDQLTVLETIRS